MKTANSTSASTVKEPRRGYEILAQEYYDRQRHPTCANFRDASARIYREWLPQCWPKAAWVCETGAGRSLVAEIAAEQRLDTGRLILLDSAMEMLQHSAGLSERGSSPLVADAFLLPFAPRSISTLLATLGDPYNTPVFWDEARRVVADDGVIILTTPAFAWSSRFRHPAREHQDVAEFELRNGQRVQVPSYVYREDAQAAMLAAHGFAVRKTMKVDAEELPPGTISPKLACAEGGEIVVGYWVSKG